MCDVYSCLIAEYATICGVYLHGWLLGILLGWIDNARIGGILILLVDNNAGLAEGMNMTRKVYQELASRIGSAQACANGVNPLWHDRHETVVNELVDTLSHGSGIDGETKLDWDKSSAERIVITGSYHVMDSNGYYGDWIDFTATIKPSLVWGMECIVKGRFGKDSDCRDYIEQCWQWDLTRDCEASIDAMTGKVDIDLDRTRIA